MMRYVKKAGVAAACLAAVLAFSMLSTPVFAQGPETGIVNEATGEVLTDPANKESCSQSFLTFPTWYKGLVNSDCSIKSPAEMGGLSTFIWRIVLNVIEMILNLVGYAAVGYIIYGGYKYMISAGSADGMSAAKKTIMNAVIGLIISIAAVAIVRTISSGMGIGG